MTTSVPSSDALLSSVYRDLDLDQGNLLTATDRASDTLAKERKEWVDKGQWLSLAKKVGAEKVFFVDNNPVFVLARTDSGTCQVH